jgi:hypothetical protein
LRQQLGMEGYGIFWFLIECLAESNGVLPLKIVPVLSMQMQVPDVKVLAVIKNFDFFQIEDDNFFSSNRLNQHLNLRKTLSDQGKKGAELRWGNSDPNSPPISNPNAKERKGKKENKGKERVIAYPDLEEVEKYFVEKGYTKEAALKAFETYAPLDWHDTKGNRILNWKSKMVNVWFREEFKAQPAGYKNKNSYV